MLLAGVLVAALAAGADGYSEQDDRFTGLFHARFTDPPKALEAMHVSGFMEVERASGKGRVFVILTRPAKSWRYLECHTTRWLVDGERLSVEAEHHGKVMDGGVIENLAFDLSAKDLARIAAAESVEYRVCNDEYTLTEAQKAGLGKVAESAERSGLP